MSTNPAENTETPATAPLATETDDSISEADQAAIAAAMAEDGGDTSAKSLKCVDCGKLFKNADLANYHAEKSGHENFEESIEEIKPLTEEEKKAKLEELRQKMLIRKAEQAEKEKKEAKANELIRRKRDQDSAALIEEAKHKEQLRQIEKDKRLKREELEAKKKIKEQIEADKRARKEKAEKERLARLGQAPPSQPAPPAAPAPKLSSSTTTANHTTARIQIRPSGIPGAPPSIVKTLPAVATIHDLAESLTADGLPGYTPDRAKFMQVYPRKEYARSEWGKTLKELGGLVPSGTVMLLLG